MQDGLPGTLRRWALVMFARQALQCVPSSVPDSMVGPFSRARLKGWRGARPSTLKGTRDALALPAASRHRAGIRRDNKPPGASPGRDLSPEKGAHSKDAPGLARISSMGITQGLQGPKWLQGGVYPPRGCRRAEGPPPKAHSYVSCAGSSCATPPVRVTVVPSVLRPSVFRYTTHLRCPRITIA